MVVKKHLIVKPLQNLETKISETICLEPTVAKTKKKKEKNTEVKMFIVAFILIVFYCYFLLFK